MAGVWIRQMGKWVMTTEPETSELDGVCYKHGGENYTMKEFLKEHRYNLPKLIIVTQGFDGGVDLDTLGMDQQDMMMFEDRAERYTMWRFLEEYRYNLPKLVTVSQGYDGGLDLDTFGYGQVMRIHSAWKQKRAVGKDGSGRNITIPLDYALLFRVCKHKKKNAPGQRLSEIVSENSLPVQVEFTCSPSCMFDVGHTQASVKSFGKITISSVYDETYCIANCIHSGALECHTILIPLYLQKVLVSTVIGIKDQSNERFRLFVRDIEKAAKGISHICKTGNENIAMYNQEDINVSNSQNIYDTLEPQKVFRLAKAQENTEEYTTLYATGNIQQPDEQNKPRETTHESSEPTEPPQLPPRRVSQMASKFQVAESPNDEKNNPYVKPPLPVRSRLNQPQKTSSKVETKDSKPAYVNDIGRAVVSPYYEVRTVKKEEIKEEKTVDSLTIDEVGERLKDLKLEKYVKPFKNERIDGCFLVEFTENIFREEFKFTDIEIIKIMKFIRTGHIPR